MYFYLKLIHFHTALLEIPGLSGYGLKLDGVLQGDGGHFSQDWAGFTSLRKIIPITCGFSITSFFLTSRKIV